MDAALFQQALSELTHRLQIDPNAPETRELAFELQTQAVWWQNVPGTPLIYRVRDLRFITPSLHRGITGSDAEMLFRMNFCPYAPAVDRMIALLILNHYGLAFSERQMLDYSMLRSSGPGLVRIVFIVNFNNSPRIEMVETENHKLEQSQELIDSFMAKFGEDFRYFIYDDKGKCFECSPPYKHDADTVKTPPETGLVAAAKEFYKKFVH